MIRIREMKREDVRTAGELEALIFSMPWRESDFLEMIEAPYAHYYVASDDGRTVAICGLRELSGEGEITNVAVHPDYRRQGLAKRLLTEALKKSESLGIKNTTLEVRASNEAAIRLYEGFGFRKEGRRPDFYERPREDALILWRRV